MAEDQIEQQVIQKCIEFLREFERYLNTLKKGLSRVRERINPEELVEITRLIEEGSVRLSEAKKKFEGMERHEETEKDREKEKSEFLTKEIHELVDHLENLEKLFSHHKEIFYRAEELGNIVRKAFEVISDDLEKEKNVIMQEIKVVDDKPLDDKTRVDIKRKQKLRLDSIIKKIDDDIKSDISKILKEKTRMQDITRIILKELEEERKYVDLIKSDLQKINSLEARFRDLVLKLEHHEQFNQEMQKLNIAIGQAFGKILSFSTYLSRESQLFDNIIHNTTKDIIGFIESTKRGIDNISVDKNLKGLTDEINNKLGNLQQKLKNYCTSTIKNKTSADRKTNLYNISLHYNKGIDDIDHAIDLIKDFVKYFKNHAIQIEKVMKNN